MTVARFTYAEAKRLLQRAVKERGEDYSYQPPSANDGCAYFENGKPGCIIGLILSYKGVTPSAAAEWNTEKSVESLILEEVIEVDSLKTHRLLDRVQALQDARHPWGGALEDAIHFVEN